MSNMSIRLDFTRIFLLANAAAYVAQCHDVLNENEKHTIINSENTDAAGECYDHSCTEDSNRKRILMFPVPITSHVTCFITIATELARKGHEIDIAVPWFFESRGKPSDGVNFVHYQVPEEPMRENNEMLPRVVEAKGANMDILRGMAKRLEQFCHSLPVENEDFFEGMKSLQHNLAIIDYMPPTKCVFLVPHRLRLPYISVVDVFEPWIARTPWIPSWSPNIVLAYSDDMTFFQRLLNTLVHITLYYMPIAKEVSPEITSEYRKYGAIDNMAELAAQSELWLIVSDPLLGYPQPLMPNSVLVGGINTKPARTVPVELEDRIAEYPEGFVLLTFGSGGGNLTEDIAKTFIEVFAGLELLVIWRFQNPEGLVLPKNVLLLDWAPQNDLLGHEKARLFITHCGKNGLYEALYHGVPVVGTPLFADQPFLGKVVESKGYGKVLNLFSNRLGDDLKQAITEVLDNSTYRNNVQKASRIFRDQQRTPLERAAYWTEHVMQFGGGYLRSAGAFKLSWYQYLMVDILLFVVTLICSVIFLLHKLIKLFCRCLTRRKI